MDLTKVFIITILIIIIGLGIILNKKTQEPFHELDKGKATTPSVLNDIKKCSSCSYCNFAETNQDYIVGRCIQQHMLCPEDLDFKPPNTGCNPHNLLAKSSGCVDIINNKLTNIENLKQNYDNNKEKFESVNIKTNREKIDEKTHFESILKSFGALV
jgi:hypothetical protein